MQEAPLTATTDRTEGSVGVHRHELRIGGVADASALEQAVTLVMPETLSASPILLCCYPGATYSRD